MGFPTGSVALRLQKKVAGKLSHRNLIKKILPDGTLDVFDHLYDLLVEYYTPKEAEKTVSNIMKVVAKLGIMFQDQKHIDDNLVVLIDMQEKLRTLFLTIQSFHHLDYSYSSSHLFRRLEEAETALLVVVRILLSSKSVERVTTVFGKFRNKEMMDEFFKIDGKFETKRGKFIEAVDLLVP